MAKWALFILPVIFVGIMACQGDQKSEADIQYDLYYDSIMVIHDRTMPLVGKIESLREQLKKERKVEINRDANKLRKINNLLGDLNKAEDSMFDWMNGFNPDSVQTDDKLNYIKSELSTIKHMEGLMLGGIGMTEAYLESSGQN